MFQEGGQDEVVVIDHGESAGHVDNGADVDQALLNLVTNLEAGAEGNNADDAYPGDGSDAGIATPT